MSWHAEIVDCVRMPVQDSLTEYAEEVYVALNVALGWREAITTGKNH